MDPRHIVDGHREKTLSFLWSIILHFQVRRRYNQTCRTLRFYVFNEDAELYVSRPVLRVVLKDWDFSVKK